MSTSLRPLVREALAALGVRRLLLGVHDAAFPSLPGEDVGRGTPSSDGAGALLAFAAELGLDGIQLGPAGATSRVDPSPYDGTVFSRSPLSIALAPLTRPEWGTLLRPAALEAAVAACPAPPGRAVYAYAYDAITGALAEVAAAFRARRAAGEGGAIADLSRRLEAFRAEHAEWLERDALHEILTRLHGGTSWREWPEPDRTLLAPPPGAEPSAGERRRALLSRHAGEVEDYALVQLLAHAQHAEVRARARALGLALFGDLQVGLSERDAWAAQGFLLAGWRMGAPPSRTDPGGQPWGFPVLDPRRYRDGDGDGPSLRFVRARARKLLGEYEGIRIDHPHGLVCPWVYPSAGEPRAAVRGGARLFESPAVPEHAGLAAFAIARADQLDPAVPRHADGWVTALDDGQVERYAILLDAVLAEAADPRDVACEILSTQPYPLRRVVERHGLGRFRVTQKRDLDRPEDVYRGENARREDWIMLGNHDTRPIWRVAESWVAGGTARRQADYLATRLLAGAAPGARDAWARETAGSPAALARASFAELFVGPARHVTVSFGDLLGARTAYNTPGTVSDTNWSQRLPPDFARTYRGRVAEGSALDLPRALATALRARGSSFASAHAALLAALDAAARSPA